MNRLFSPTLPAQELTSRAKAIRLVLTDNDGTLTDGCVFYSAQGELLKRYSLRDGMGVELLKLAGIETGIITRETNEITRRRAEKLNIQNLYLGVQNKGAHLADILNQHSLNLSQVAYIGDDVNDFEIMQQIAPHGLTGAPSDADAKISAIVHFISDHPGGKGAFRSFADWILAARASLDVQDADDS